MTTSRILPITYNTSTFGGITRDYQSIAAWETATDNDLVTATNGEVLDCYADSANYDQSFSAGGATVNADYFRVVRAASGQEWGGDLSSGFQLVKTESGIPEVVNVNALEPYFGVYDIVIQYNANSTSGSRRAVAFYSDFCKIIGCAITGVNSGSGSGYGLLTAGGNTYYLINNLFYGSDGRGALTLSSTAIYYYNNTIVNNGAEGLAVDAACHLVNNIIQDNSSPFSGTPGTNLNNVTAGALFRDAANDDYLLDAEDTAAKGRGADLSSDANFPFDDDLLKITRIDPWTSGMHDLLATPSQTILSNLTPNTDIVRCGVSESIQESGDLPSGTTIREYMTKGQRFRAKQTGNITGIDLYTHALINITGIFFKVWRKNSGGFYDLINISENILSKCAPATTNLIIFIAPITGVQEGDYYGFKITSSALQSTLFGSAGGYTNTTLYFRNSAAGDSNEDIEGWSSSASEAIPTNLYMLAPVFVGIGDSIMAGHLSHYSFTETTETTNLLFPIHPRLRALLNVTYTWQNRGDGSDTTAQIASRITADLTDLKPRFAILNGGVNDIAGAVPKATFLTNWTTILDACIVNDITPIVMLIAPWTNGTNIQMQTRDDFNADLITLAVTYSGAIIVDLDKALGVFRAGGDPGNLWDIQAAYDNDGVHFTTSGMQAITQDIYNNIPLIPGDSTRYNSVDKIPRTNNYQGDPRLFLDENGSYLKFKGGQPVMDQGLENKVYIKLFTRKGWAGNTLFSNPANHIGSDFELSLEAPITLQSFNNTRAAALKALDDPAFGDVSVEVTNPESYRRNVLITIKPPGGDILTFLITKSGLNWTAQKLNPAYKRE